VPRDISHEAVRDWETKLTPALAENLRRRRRGKAGPSWYVDESVPRTHDQQWACGAA
jgi:transposase-like protein